MKHAKRSSVAPPPSVLDEYEHSPRERIYAAALRCFQRDGVPRTTMDTIASEAGLSRPTIYYYFKDKQALIIEAVMRQQAESHRLHKEQLAGRLTGLAAIVEAAALSIERAISNPYTALLTRPENERLTATAMHSPAARELQAAFWGPLLADARTRGELRNDLADGEIIEWIMFIEFSVVTNGPLLGLTGAEPIRTALRRFVSPALGGNGALAPARQGTRAIPRKNAAAAPARKVRS